MKPKLYDVYLSGKVTKHLAFFAFDDKDAKEQAEDWIKDNKYAGDVYSVIENTNFDMEDFEI